VNLKKRRGDGVKWKSGSGKETDKGRVVWGIPLPKGEWKITASIIIRGVIIMGEGGLAKSA